MGTRWRGLLAPINTPTGDGRRMAPGAFTNRPLPLPLKWQRTDEGGHTTSVVVGSMDMLDIGEDGVWGEGELFDDVSPTATPRLAEDVAEAKVLLGKKVIGPSVDPGSAQAVTVMKGSDDPLDDQAVERYWMRYGKMPETELLFTSYEIAAATLVPVPAFAQCRPFELLDASGEPMDETSRSLVAAAPMPVLDPALFANPELPTWTPATMVDLGNGWTHVYGHVATHDVCHVGMRGVCVNAPYSDHDYVPFHRYSVTKGGHELPVVAGRLTSGLGRLENVCGCHPGNDDHACGNLSLGGAVAHHDRMEVLAYVCVGEDEPNNAIWFSGVLNPEASEQARKVLGRRKVSGDWREYGASMELVEVLVLARREPGFPLPRVSMENGRQVSLTAAGAIMAEPLPELDATGLAPESELAASGATAVGPDGIDYDRLGAIVAQKLIDAATPAAELAADDDELCVDEDGELCADHLDDLAFNPDQKRDGKGRWTKGGGAGGVSGTDAPGEGAGGGGSPGRAQSGRAAAAEADPEPQPVTPAEAVSNWADQMRAEYPDLKLDVAQSGSGHVVLSRIVLPKGERGKGTGSKIMQSLVDLADELGVPLALTPSADFGGSVARLKKFYEGFGFVPNKGRNRDFEISETYIRPARRGVTAAAKEGGHTGAMVALRMTDADAERLAVEGGLPPEEMHMTLAYLGEAADIPAGAREKILRGMGRIAKKVGGPLQADGFSVNAFNPGNANDRPTAIVMGINGAMLGSLQQGVCKTLGNCDGLDMPEQHEPWTAHATLAYDGDLSKIEKYADRVGPLTFDRMRVAFGGEVTDIPLGEIIETDEAEQEQRDADGDVYAARGILAAELAAELDAIAAEMRADEVAELLDHINTVALAAAD